jgi:hypothetical protein
MPHITAKQLLINEIDDYIKFSWLLDLSTSEEIEEALEFRVMITMSRFTVPRQQIAKNKSMLDIIWKWGEKGFKQEARMTRLIQNFGSIDRATSNIYK